MKHLLRSQQLIRPLASVFLFAALWFLAPALVGAAPADAVAPVETWPPAGPRAARTIFESLGLTALFGISGVVLAIVGYKLFDKCTPGDLHKEILENKNIAAAIIAAAVILGVSLIIAASIIG